MIKIQVPKDVTFIIGELNKAGFEAFAVGGCVRDTLLNRVPDDWDITTSASPYEVKHLFNKTIDTGLVHGTVTVMLNRVGYEVTTYRIDGEYRDGRHPDTVTFTTNLVEDLKRRDFTINAMAYNDLCGIVDEFQGIQDLEEKRIRCVGKARERFREDALRMLRAVRFSAQLGFTVDAETEEAICEMAPTLEKISRERVQVELNKLLLSEHPEQIAKVYDMGLARYALPGTEEFEKKEVRKKAAGMLLKLPQSSVLRWTALLHFCTEKQDYGRKILRGLKFDNHTSDYVSALVKLLPQPVWEKEGQIRRTIHEVGEEIFELYLTMKEAELQVMREEGVDTEGELLCLQREKDTYHMILERGDCTSLKTLSVTGRDLMEAGLPAGKELGLVLNRLLEHVLEHPQDNQKEILMRYLEEK